MLAHTCHTFGRNDVSYYQHDDQKEVKTIILKFKKDFMGQGTFSQPEFSEINALLEQSKFGICFGDKIRKELHSELMTIVDLPPAMQSIKMMDLLFRLSPNR